MRQVPRHRELVLRRPQERRVPAVRALPAPRARQRPRPPVLGRRARATGRASTRRRTRSSDPRVAPPARASTRSQGFFISWNNKEAPGWRKGPAEWSDGPGPPRAHPPAQAAVQPGRERRQGRPRRRSTRAVNLAATDRPARRGGLPVDAARDRQAAAAASTRLLALLDAWQRSGAQRLDANGDNVYDHSAAVALMDAWWPRAVTRRVPARARQAPVRRDPERTSSSLARPSAGTGRARSRRTCATCSGAASAVATRGSTAAAASAYRRSARCRAPAAAAGRGCSRRSMPPHARSRPSRARRSVELEGARHLRRPIRRRATRIVPEHRGRGRHAAVPVAEPRHLPPGRRGQRPPLTRGARCWSLNFRL